MAKSSKTLPKTGTLTEFPQPETAPIVPQGAVAVEEAPEEPEGVPEGFQEAAPVKRGRGAPRKTDPPIETNFFQKVASIAAADWGTRVYLYLYQIEPVCDLKQSGGKAYLMRYQEPIKDEHQVMLEQGSGKYRFVLALNKISPANSNELCRHDFEIYNPKYPPRIPKAVWVNDPRNRRWEALLPKEAEAVPQTAASTIVDAMKMVSDIRRDVRDEMPEPAAQNGSLLDTVRLMKELMPQQTPAAAPAPAKDPLEIAVSLMTIMNQQRAENPIGDMMRDELKALREELTQARKVQAGPPPKSFLDQLMELAQQDKLEPIKKVFGMFTGNGGGGETVARAAKVTGMEILREVVSGPAGAVLAQGVASLLQSVGRAAQPAPPQQYPTVLNAQNADATIPPIENPENRIQRIGATITKPLITAFMRGGAGSDFAQSFFDINPEDFVFMRQLGAADIIRRYKAFPEAWNAVQFRENDFMEFITELCTWDPNEDEGPAPAEGDAGIVDLDTSEVEA